ncbi:Retrotransposon gag protein [Arachis hypogaea]|nr:Retrotransposon gag protein [Arachis hypogaea]
MTFEKALCDLGSRINMMPLSIMEKLGIYEVQAAKFSLEMADKSMKKAYGLVEDVLVKVEGLYFPTDFIILDTRRNEDESIILGRSFPATARAVIDVDRGELILRVNEECLLVKTQGSPSSTWRVRMKSFSQYKVKQSPHIQTLSLVLGGHSQTLSLVLRDLNHTLIICETP